MIERTTFVDTPGELRVGGKVIGTIRSLHISHSPPAFDRPAPFDGMHHFDLASHICTICSITLLQLNTHGDRPCQRGLWPLEVAVPRRQTPNRGCLPWPN